MLHVTTTDGGYMWNITPK